MLLVRTGAEVVMSEDRTDGAVVSLIVDKGVGPPALYSGLSAHPLIIGAWTEDRMGFLCQQLLTTVVGDLPDIVGMDSLPHLFRREGTVLVVISVGTSIGGCDIELHEVNVLTDDVGRREDLEIIEVEIVR